LSGVQKGCKLKGIGSLQRGMSTLQAYKPNRLGGRFSRTDARPHAVRLILSTFPDNFKRIFPLSSAKQKRITLTFANGRK